MNTLSSPSTHFQRSSSSKIINYSLLGVLIVILFVPKINLFYIPGSSITVKPEDVFWILISPFLLCSYNLFTLRGPLRKTFSLLIGYLGVSSLFFFSNIFVMLRFIFYSFPIFYNFSISINQRRFIYQLTRSFLITSFFVALGQKFFTLPGVHTGEIVFGPMSRPSFIFGNSVEFSLVVVFAWQIFNIIKSGSYVFYILSLATVFLTETRLVFFVLLLYPVFLLIRILRKYFLQKRFALILGLFASIFFALLILPNIYGVFSTLRDSSIDDQINFFELMSNSIAAFITHSNTGLYSLGNYSYCFDFDNTLSIDQSFAMRLSKAAFVVNSVLIDGQLLGHGAGRCIGDSADLLYIRLLNDGGIPLLLLFALFIYNLFQFKIEPHLYMKFLFFVFSLLSLAFFYDVIYFSRVGPLIFIYIALAFRQNNYSSYS